MPSAANNSSVSVIICTRNRAAMLERTLHAFAKVTVPPGMQAELIVADNGSTDHTANLVKEFQLENFEIRYLPEGRPGKSQAQNSALAVARGEALLFTDDDVEPSANWLESMAQPLFNHEAEAVAGRILLAPELQRAWFTPLHRHWLAVVDHPAQSSPELIGANMGIHRSVFEKVGEFDIELGPGTLGFGEETLLWRQMCELGMRIRPVTDALVIHHPEPDRLRRSSWLASGKKHGAAAAYLEYHWEHKNLNAPARLAKWFELKLRLRRLLQRPAPMTAEGCAEWEMCYVSGAEWARQFARESQRPRNYERHGLRKKISTALEPVAADWASVAAPVNR